MAIDFVGYAPIVPDLFAVELDDGVIVARHDGRPDDAAFDAYLDAFTELVMREIPYASVYSCSPGSRMPSVGQAKKQAAWIRDHRRVIETHCRGLAFSLPTPLVRGAFHAILSMQPFGVEHRVMENEQAAVAWAKQRLRASTG